MKKFYALFLVIFVFFSLNHAFAKGGEDYCRQRNYDFNEDIEFTGNNEYKFNGRYFNEIKGKRVDSLDPFQLLFVKNHEKELAKKLSGDFDINSCGGPYDTSLLSLAATLGLIDDVKMIINHGANLDSPKDSAGQSALMLAISVGQYEIANYLIKKGADIKTTTRHGHNALHALAESINSESRNKVLELDLASTLISSGIPLNKKYENTINGSTPLMLAIITDKPALVQLFMECGADPYIKNQRGRDSFDIAKTRDSFNASKNIKRKESMLDILQRPRPASSSCNVHELSKSTD